MALPLIGTLEPRPGCRMLGRTALRVRRPAARVLAGGARDRVDRHDSIDAVVEKRAVVRHDHQTSGKAIEKALETRETIEIKVVGGLVERRVCRGARADGRERGSTKLAARQLGSRTLEFDTESDLSRERPRAGFEIATTQCNQPVKGGFVGNRGTRIVRARAAAAAAVQLRGGHASSPC